MTIHAGALRRAQEKAEAALTDDHDNEPVSLTYDRALIHAYLSDEDVEAVIEYESDDAYRNDRRFNWANVLRAIGGAG